MPPLRRSPERCSPTFDGIDLDEAGVEPGVLAPLRAAPVPPAPSSDPPAAAAVLGDGGDRRVRRRGGGGGGTSALSPPRSYGGAAAGGRRGRRRRRTARDELGWALVRLVLALLIVAWFGAVATVKSHGDQGGDAKVDLGKDKEDEAANNHEGQLPLASLKIHSIYDLSLLGTKSPDDFRPYAPGAPPCSDPLDAADVSYTIVSQLSHDRIWMVPHHCERWGADNPMSLAVFTDLTPEEVKDRLVAEGCSGERLAVQTVSPKAYDPTGTEYPVNVLRNLALSKVRTSHVVYADVDFWPAADLHDVLSLPNIRKGLAKDPKLAAVVPVFQMFRQCDEYRDCGERNVPRMPRDKEELMTLVAKRQASTFDPTNAGGHGSTRYLTWRDQARGTYADLPCVKSNRYEPYLVVRRCDALPPFQEGFTGYGKNKMTWAMHLRRAGYLFTQVGGAFLVHYPHLDSKSRLEWNKHPKVEKGHSINEVGDVDLLSFKRARVDSLFLDFKDWLHEEVEDESRVHMCGDAMNDDLKLWVHRAEEVEDAEIGREDADQDVISEKQEDIAAEEEVNESPENEVESGDGFEEEVDTAEVSDELVVKGIANAIQSSQSADKENVEAETPSDEVDGDEGVEEDENAEGEESLAAPDVEGDAENADTSERSGERNGGDVVKAEVEAEPASGDEIGEE
ncbi:hypothetical protein ACHAWF_004846 [Thalassiosira exigua]